MKHEIKKMHDDDLLLKTKELVARERETLIEVLNHLAEVDRRGLYLARGFSSLWAYMTCELKYSEAAAQRRIEALRALSEVPAIEAKIATGVLSISNIAKVQTVLKRAKKSGRGLDAARKFDLFSQIENKSQREAELILAEQFSEQFTRVDSVRLVSEKTCELRLTIPREAMKKLERVRELMSHKFSNPQLGELIEAMADFVISKKDLSVKGEAKSKPVVASANGAAASQWRQPPQRRFIAAEVKRQVWRGARDEKTGEVGCEFVDETSGRRCNSRHQLEIEHKEPIAFGGGSELENLQVLCRAHNRWRAELAKLGWSGSPIES